MNLPLLSRYLKGVTEVQCKFTFVKFLEWLLDQNINCIEGIYSKQRPIINLEYYSLDQSINNIDGILCRDQLQ